MHQRLKPFGHRFEYTVFSLLIDLDRIKDAARQTWLFSLNGFNLAAFFERDHIDPRVSIPDKGLAQDYVAAVAEQRLQELTP